MRLDVLLYKKGLIRSRVQARDIILENRVFVDSRLVNTPGKRISEGSNIEILHTPIFVSRSGRKLHHFIQKTGLSKDLVIADIGSSTGGFAQVLLPYAKRIYCIDIGSNQLHPALLKNSKIVSLENTDIRNADIGPVDLAVVDLSFISITKVFEHIKRTLKKKGRMIILIKPQYESTPDLVKKGILPEKYHPPILNSLKEFFLPFKTIILEESILKGKNGNTEYFILLEGP